MAVDREVSELKNSLADKAIGLLRNMYSDLPSDLTEPLLGLGVGMYAAGYISALADVEGDILLHERVDAAKRIIDDINRGKVPGEGDIEEVQE
jgi:hypothetical protein